MESNPQDLQENVAAIENAPAESPQTAEKGTVETPGFGWNSYAERINGRFAMVGFVALLLLELLTRKDFFTWLGF